jgi:hypothetical protein
MSLLLLLPPDSPHSDRSWDHLEPAVAGASGASTDSLSSIAQLHS